MPYRIEGFPESIAEVPETAREWLLWRDKVLAFRELIHRKAEEGPQQRAAIAKLAANDPAFFMAIFGVLFDPKGDPDMRVNEDGEVEPMEKPPAWYPWIPYPFQVETIRWYQEVRSHRHGSKGRGDGVVEKSRDMGITWTFCLVAAHEWLFKEDSTFGLISYKEDLVKDDSPKGMMYKVKALLDLNKHARIPERCYAPGTPYHQAPAKMPEWLKPAGFDPKVHSLSLSLKHPSKNNVISGESTTSKSGIGDRQGAVFVDEGAKNDKLLDIWTGLAAVTHHRFTFSSADRRYGDGMYTLVEKARQAQANPDLSGPSFLSLPYDVHPLRDAGWLEDERARFEGTADDFDREYLIGWNAGAGDWVYPSASSIIPGNYEYNPIAGDVYVSIDPGLRDPTAIQFYQYDPVDDVYVLFDALTLEVPSAEFLAPILMGWPLGHEVRTRVGYAYNTDIQDVMERMWGMRKTGRSVLFVGDPYGDNAGGSSKESFYTSMYLTSLELSREYTEYEGEQIPPFPIQVLTKYDEGARYHRARKESLTKLIPKIRFNDVPRVRYVISALREHRYKPLNPNGTTQNEPSGPVHDWTSHHASAAEFLAVNAKAREVMMMPQLKPTKATNQSRRRNKAANQRRQARHNGWDTTWTM